MFEVLLVRPELPRLKPAEDMIDIYTGPVPPSIRFQPLGGTERKDNNPRIGEEETQ